MTDFLLKPDGFSDQNILRSLKGHEEYREHEKFMFTWNVCKSNENKLSPFSSIQFCCSVVSDSLRLHEPQHARLPCPSPTPGVHSDSRPSSRWCHSSISSSVVLFSSCLQPFPASGSFQMSQLFASGGQRIGVSASTSVLPMNTQDWSPLEWTGWISLQSKGLSRVFNTTVQKHQLFGAQLYSPTLLLGIFFWLLQWWVSWFPCRPRDSQESSTPQFRSISSLALRFL